jgi:hypothetical protein
LTDGGDNEREISWSLGSPGVTERRGLKGGEYVVALNKLHLPRLGVGLCNKGISGSGHQLRAINEWLAVVVGERSYRWG